MAGYDLQPGYQPSNSRGFNLDTMEKFNIDHGSAVKWEHAFSCPCISETGQPRQDCPICHGIGYAFMNPQQTTLLLQEMGDARSSSSLGIKVPGTAIATSTRSDQLNFRDRITCFDQTIPVSLLINLSESDVTNGVYLRYHVKSVDFAYTLANKEINPAKIKIDANTDIYYPDVNLVNSVISLNLSVVLRFYVIQTLRTARYQYAGDPRDSISENRKFTSLTRKYLLRREDMYVPNILGSGQVPSTGEQPRNFGLNLDGFIHQDDAN